MNIRAVLRTYGMLRSLTDDESALLETLRRFTETEREAFVEALGPQKPATKRKRSSKSAGKSAKAQSLASAIKPALDGGVSKMRCDYRANDGDDPTACGEYTDANIHHRQTMTGYHEFVPSATNAARAGAGAGGAGE
jgi:hypothetical protein